MGPRPELRGRGRGRGRGQDYEVEAKAEAENNYENGTKFRNFARFLPENVRLHNNGT